MQAIILASGLGTRMLPLTLERPKPLIEVAGKSILEHVLDVLPEEIDEIIIVIGYKASMIREKIGGEYKGIPVRYVFQWMQAGTAHALSIAHPFITGKFLLLNADDILGQDALAEAVKHPLAILAAPHEEPEKFGVIYMNEDGTIKNIVEKPEHPESNLVSTGAMVLDVRLFGYEAVKHPKGEYFITDPVSALIQDHPMKVIVQPIWIPVGYPEDIPKAEARLKEIEEESKR